MFTDYAASTPALVNRLRHTMPPLVRALKSADPAPIKPQKPVVAQPIQQIAKPAPAIQPAIQPTDATSTEFINFTNDHRKKNNLQPLTLSSRLSETAQNRAKEIADNWTADKKSWNHDSFLKAGVTPGYYAVGENLAQGYETNSERFKAWVSSPTHNANLLKENYREIGMGSAQTKDGRWIVVQHFGNPK